jgi:hypothetical protein
MNEFGSLPSIRARVPRKMMGPQPADTLDHRDQADGFRCARLP